MSKFMKNLATVMMILAVLEIIAGFMGTENDLVVGMGLGLVMVSGCAWLLSDIAESARSVVSSVHSQAAEQARRLSAVSADAAHERGESTEPKS